MPIKHKFVSAVADGADATQVRPSNWNDTHDIDRGSATLDANGTVTVLNTAVTTADRIFLSCQSGNSNMTIKVSAVVAGVSFTITSSGGEDDAGLVIGWFIL